MRQLQIHHPIGSALGVDRNADGQRRTIQRKKTGFRLHTHANGGRNDERLVNAARADNVGQGLHYHAKANGNAVEIELRPCAEWIRREGALAPGFIRNVVIRLLGGGPREIRGRGLGVVGHVQVKERVG